MMHGAIRMERLFHAMDRPPGKWFQDFIHPSTWVTQALVNGVLSALCPYGEFMSERAQSQTHHANEQSQNAKKDTGTFPRRGRRPRTERPKAQDTPF
jgi:hypothetical protein